MPTTYLSITPRTADRLIGGDPSAASNTFIRDTGLPGFAIVVGRSKSSFVVEARAGRHGRNVRVTLGTVGQLPLEDARRKAKETIARLANGVDVVAEARAKAARSITLDNALQELLARRDLKPSTVADYIRSVETLVEWRAKPLASITPDMVVRQWGRMPGKTSAARVFRVLRTIWNHAREAGADIGESPTRALRNVRRSWAQAPRKRRMIPDALLPAWRDAVSTIGHEGIRDLVWFVFYTGCRIGEARALTAGEVDLQAGAFRFAAPKNGRQLELPIVAQLGDVLKRRVATASRGPIFPQDLSRYWLRPTLEVCEWSWHDLRRGYITAAHRAGTDPEVARALVNHSAPAGDSHGGYVILSADSMRADAQRVAGFLDRLGVQDTKIVVE
jgi:integrase